MAVHEGVSVAAAKRGLPDLLNEAANEPVVIFRREEADAVLLPYDDFVRLRRMRAAAGMRRIAERMRGRHIDVQQLLDESRQELEDRTQ